MRTCKAGALALLCVFCLGSFGFRVYGGGSGLNTVVILNQASSNSCALANYFCERRDVPPENVLRIRWPGSNIAWSSADFQTCLLQPFLAMLAERGLTNQVDYVVLSMDIPFQTVFGSTINSTTAAMFYGLKPDPVFGSRGLTNSYFESEAPFRQAQPVTAPGYSFLATMLTADSLAQAKRIVDQGVLSDGRFPTSPAFLEKTSDSARNIRYTAFDHAILDTRVLGNSFAVRTNSDLPPGPAAVLGYQTGLPNFTLAPGTLLAGSIADSLTSFGGLIFGPNQQTSLLAFLAAGAAGSYGTVAEPFTDLSKFPTPHVYFYQSRGFTLAESYYQSLKVPYLGLIVGEPLAAPFAHADSGRWSGVTSNAVLTGVVPLAVRFWNSFPEHPVQQIDLFVDGKFLRTLTNAPPTPGNLLTVHLNGYPVRFTVPPDATLPGIARGVVSNLNAAAVTNLTQVMAFARGDRIELRRSTADTQAPDFFFVDRSATNLVGRTYRVRYLPEPSVPEFFPPTRLPNGTFQLRANTAVGWPSTIEASVNLVDWIPLTTSVMGGLLAFEDIAARDWPQRFYRIGSPDPHPVLHLTDTGGSARVHVDSPTTWPYVLQTSTNLVHWTTLVTNFSGGALDYAEVLTGRTSAVYRTAPFSGLTVNPQVSLVGPATSEGQLLRISGAARQYILEVSTNFVDWTALVTNTAFNLFRVQASSSSSAGEPLSTLICAMRETFLSSTARGSRKVYVDGAALADSWIRIIVTKTNGVSVPVTITNLPAGTLEGLAQRLVEAINSEAALSGSDGVKAEDFAPSYGGGASFYLRPVSPGYAAAAVQVLLTGSSTISISPWTTSRLDQNAGDLQPRNHLYLGAGDHALSAQADLDTRILPDGFHHLTAVAYEGTSVRTQTRATVPVVIQNSSLSGSLELADLSEPATAQGLFRANVSANTSNVSRISLFTTGGEWASVTNQPAGTFSVDAAALGPGLHPFFALIQTTDGLQYRTQTRFVRLVGW